MNYEMKQQIKSTILNYLDKVAIPEEEELDWEEIMIEAKASWKNQILEEVGLNDSTDAEKDEFIKNYENEWKNNFIEDEFYFEPNITEDDEILYNSIFQKDGFTIDVNDFFIWLDSKEFNPVLSKEKKSKIKLNCSPTKFKNLLVKFFENKGIIIDDDKHNRITCFITNCFLWSSKYSLKSEGDYTINFFEKKSFVPFIALLLYLSRIDKKIEFKSVTSFSNLLNTELKQNNKNHIGLSNNLRNKITKNLLNKNIIELCKLTGFKNSIEIKTIINN